MRTQLTFIATLCFALALAWLTSGERFLDWIFLMPDVGAVDDAVITFVMAVEDRRQQLQVVDLFAQARAWLHSSVGLNQ